LLALNSPAAGGKMRTLWRLWAWQIWRRTVRRPIEVELSTGRLEFPAWSTLAGLTAATGMHEPAEQLFVRSYLREGDGVIDVGANLGIYTVMCCGLGARVWAFEPSSLARDALATNVRLNAAESRVRIYTTALGAAESRMGLTTGLDGANHLVDLAQDGSPAEEIEVSMLDSIMEREGQWFCSKPLSLVKVDVEGFDEEVLRGAAATITAQKPVIIVESWAGGTSVRSLLATWGYRVYRYDHVGGRLIEYPSTWSGQANFIAVSEHRLFEVEQRLSACRATPDAPIVHWKPRASGPQPVRDNRDASAASL